MAATWTKTPLNPPTNTMLIADIGGTNARFAIAQHQRITHLQILSTTLYPEFIDALNAYQAYLSQNNVQIHKAIFAIAAPVTGDFVHFTNSPWSIDVNKAQKQLTCPIILINDFEAQALALQVPHLETMCINQPNPELALQHDTKQQRKLILGPGTGFGVAYTLGDQIIATEAGHMTLPSTNAQEFEIFNYLNSHYGHVSAERVCCGQGLEALYRFFTGQTKEAHIIHQTALTDPNSFDAQAISQFLKYFGTIAGQLALSIDATAGVYLTGGISQKLQDSFINSKFRARFTDKGRFSEYLSQIPVWLILEEQPALLGMAYKYSKKAALSAGLDSETSLSESR